MEEAAPPPKRPRVSPHTLQSDTSPEGEVAVLRDALDSSRARTWELEQELAVARKRNRVLEEARAEQLCPPKRQGPSLLPTIFSLDRPHTSIRPRPAAHRLIGCYGRPRTLEVIRPKPQTSGPLKGTGMANAAGQWHPLNMFLTQRHTES